jgi:uncharacterized protein
MFRTMRRSKQQLSSAETTAVMTRGTYGVLACFGDHDYPYAVPLSYVFVHDKIYFHSAKTGHKMEAISNREKVSFAVVDEDRVISQEYTTLFRSAVVFGRARIVEGDERLAAFQALVDKYSGCQPEDERMREIARCEQSLIVAIDIDHMTGKEAIEFVRAKAGK